MHGSRLGGSNRRAGVEAQIEGQSRECGASEIHCHFIAPAPSRKHQALSAQCSCRSRYLSFDQKLMRLTKRTKDRKKGCAYDPGVLSKQGALKKNRLTICKQ